jgi:ribonuclease HII
MDDSLEHELTGGCRAAGTDEAGAGPLAGPVVAAAVILDPARPILGLNDSKKLSEAKREELFPLIRERALAFAIVEISVEEIDRLNIFNACLLGMRRAIEQLNPAPDMVLADARRIPGLRIEQRAIIKGDARCASIAAASILAKVHRDRVMTAIDAVYPGYGFAKHKGYGAPEHLEALRRLGPTPYHRRSFAPVRAALAGDDKPQLSLF